MSGAARSAILYRQRTCRCQQSRGVWQQRLCKCTSSFTICTRRSYCHGGEHMHACRLCQRSRYYASRCCDAIDGIKGRITAPTIMIPQRLLDHHRGSVVTRTLIWR